MSKDNDFASKGDRNKIYFLIVVIVALLGTNAYLLIKDKQDSKRFVNVSTEKDRLKLEVEKIEVELDKVNSLNVSLDEKLLDEQKQAREKIAELKLALQNNNFSQEELSAAQNKVKELRDFVKRHNEDILRLERENFLLRSEMDSLKASANSAARKAEELERRNSELNARVATSAALKASNVRLIAYKVKSNGKNIEVTRASTAKKLSVKFDIVPNQLAKKDYHKIYLRVFDPAGNLIANETNMFEADGQEMQFSSATSISYNNDNTSYSMDWINPVAFLKGTYSVILYSDGYTMGRTTLRLR